jgi:hypothetical protein
LQAGCPLFLLEGKKMMQNNIPESKSKLLQPKKPYVGLRPYEREERSIFFGRDRDAKFLTDKIFSAKLSIFYSLSGLGKSSILRTLVIPRLEKENSRVVYFDDWSGEDPATNFKDNLVSLAEKLGIPDPAAGAPTLSELVRLLVSYDNRTLVLILDQFEDFLVSHGQHLDPLRSELSRIVRTGGFDVHVLISLRQEYLASLEPFRTEIIKLFESTYHLEHLDDMGVSDAIQRPAKVFGASVEDKLVEALKADLSKNVENGGRQNTLDHLRLPMLQLVCSELWDAAQEKGESILTLDLYEELGRSGEILKTYVQKVMPQRWSDRRLTARLMQFLAPASGLKVPYSAEDLSDITQLEKDKIKSELERLRNLRILRTREFSKEPRFELEHDAFIKIVSPWRDKVLHHVRWMRRLKLGFSCIFMVMLLCLGFVIFRHYESNIEHRKNTDDVIETLAEKPINERPYLLEKVTLYLLEKGSGHYVDLKRHLKNNYDLLPAGYGLERNRVDQSKTKMPLSFHYSSDPSHFPNYIPEAGRFIFRYSSNRNFSSTYFSETWQLIARKLTEIWGIPVPKRIHLLKDPLFPKDAVQFYDPHEVNSDGLYFNMPTHEEKAFINPERLPGLARDFFDKFKDDWIHIEQLEKLNWGVPSTAVHRWSLPVWNASGLHAIDGNGAPAYLLAAELMKKPELLLTQQAFEFLINHVRQEFEYTVREAELARKSNLRKDLIKIVDLGHPLLSLPFILDALAQYPAETSEEVAKLVGESLKSRDAILPSRLHGPVSDHMAGHEGPSAPATRDFGSLYPEVEKWLPRLGPLFHVYLGRNLQLRYLHEGEPTATLNERLLTFNDEFYRKLGFDFPDVLFGRDPFLEDEQFRIVEVPNEIALDLDNILHEEQGKPEFDQLFDALRSRARNFQVHWLTAEHVQKGKSEIEPALKEWLDHRYSLTHLKLLLRGVIYQTPEKFGSSGHAKGGYVKDISLGYSLRHINWLLGSLVFWTRVSDPLDLEKMSSHLRETQESRIKSQSMGANAFLADKDCNISNGIQAIAEGRLENAEAAFDRAIEMNSEASVKKFLETYPKILTTKLRRHFAQKCTDLNYAFLQKGEQFDLEELISTAGEQIGKKEKRHLKLCLFSSYRSATHQKKIEFASELFSEFKAFNEWPANDAGWFSVEVMKNFKPLEDETFILEQAKTLLKSTLNRLGENQNYAAFLDVKNMCNQGTVKNWCRQFLIEWAEIRPDRDLLLELAFYLSLSKQKAELQRALELLERAEKKIVEQDSPSEKQKELLDIANLYRAYALMGLAELGNQDYWKEVNALLDKLSDSNTVSPYTKFARANLMMNQERYDETDLFLETGENIPLTSPTLFTIKIWANLFKGETDSAGRIIDEAINKFGRNSDLLFVKALFNILTGRDQRALTSLVYLEKDPIYADYLTVFLYTAPEDSISKIHAKHRLTWRWNHQIDPDKWEKRLSKGDQMVWQEMLIGYCLGKIQRSEIFEILEDDESFGKSKFSKLPLSRLAMLCEAYFIEAMMAKAEGNNALERKRLQQVLDTNQRGYYEYRMAKFFLENQHNKRLTGSD